MSDLAGSRLGLGFSQYFVRSLTVHNNQVNAAVGFPVRVFLFYVYLTPSLQVLRSFGPTLDFTVLYLAVISHRNTKYGLSNEILALLPPKSAKTFHESLQILSPRKSARTFRMMITAEFRFESLY